MEHLQSRSDLIAIVARKAPSPQVKRACVYGRVECLGAFDEDWGWLIRVATKRGHTTLISVKPGRPEYHVGIAPWVPWELWIGSTTDTVWTFRSGDHPVLYNRLRLEALDDPIFEPVPDLAR